MRISGQPDRRRYPTARPRRTALIAALILMAFIQFFGGLNGTIDALLQWALVLLLALCAYQTARDCIARFHPRKGGKSYPPLKLTPAMLIAVLLHSTRWKRL